jgi:hypothetical protein
MQLRVQKESRRDYIRSTIGQARAHGPCLYMFDIANMVACQHGLRRSTLWQKSQGTARESKQGLRETHDNAPSGPQTELVGFQVVDLARNGRGPDSSLFWLCQAPSRPLGGVTG